MANSSSSKKRIKTAKRNKLNNRFYISSLRTSIKCFKSALLNKDIELATYYFKKSYSLIDKAKKRRILHRNTAARKKSQLSKCFNIQ